MHVINRLRTCVRYPCVRASRDGRAHALGFRVCSRACARVRALACVRSRACARVRALACVRGGERVREHWHAPLRPKLRGAKHGVVADVARHEQHPRVRVAQGVRCKSTHGYLQGTSEYPRVLAGY
jgi:hypothetical protein